MIHIHPFPARMAPEIALSGLDKLPQDFVVLDPMAGSGMVLGTAAKLGLRAIGYDIDPLACMISKVNGTRVIEKTVRSACNELIEKTKKLSVEDITLPWIDKDIETKRYIEFWFASNQIDQLRRLSFLLVKEPFTSNITTINVLKVAVSRLIVTKEPKASRARDTAHSRPHRTIIENEFDVIDALPKSLDHVLKALSPNDVLRDVSAYRGDARKMGRIKSDSIDRILTSPPYLNAIDYMRGHRLALIWFGYSLCALRKLRSRYVGAEISRSQRMSSTVQKFFENLHPDVDERKRNMLRRYYTDLWSITREAYRVLAPSRKATYVIGNSRVKGHEVRNCDLLNLAAKQNGFEIVDHFTRQIPEQKRYLPLLSSQGTNLARRMNTEHIVTFRK